MSPCPSIQARGERERERTNRSRKLHVYTQDSNRPSKRRASTRPAYKSTPLSSFEGGGESEREEEETPRTLRARARNASSAGLGGSDRLLLAGAAALAGLHVGQRGAGWEE